MSPSKLGSFICPGTRGTRTLTSFTKGSRFFYSHKKGIFCLLYVSPSHENVRLLDYTVDTPSTRKLKEYILLATQILPTPWPPVPVTLSKRNARIIQAPATIYNP